MKLKALIKAFPGHIVTLAISGNSFPDRSTHPGSDRYVLDTNVGSLTTKPIGDLDVIDATATGPSQLVVHLKK